MCVCVCSVGVDGSLWVLCADASLPHTGKHRSLSTNAPHSYLCSVNMDAFDWENENTTHVDCTGAGAVKL